jgi:uncharacterized protein (TIGR03435 family)
MTIRACVARAVLLTGAVWLVSSGNGWAQAAVEAGALGAASSSAGSAAGKAAGNSVGSALGGLGGRMNAATKPAAPASSATTTMVLRADPPVGKDTGAPGIVTVAGPQPEIHFDVVSFQKCAGAAGSNKVDIPADGDSVAYHCQPVYRMLTFAYAGGEDFNLTGYPSWVTTDLYDMQAKVAPEDFATWQKMGVSARKLAVRKLLADQLKLKVKVNSTPKPVYTLSVAESGPKLKEYKTGEQETLPNGLTLNGKDMTWVGRIAYFQDMSIAGLVDSLSAHLDRPVVNQTGLEGSYNFSLPLPHGSGTSAGANMMENMPSVAEALADLGLKLESDKTFVEGVVVQHIERPAAD